MLMLKISDNGIVNVFEVCKYDFVMSIKVVTKCQKVVFLHLFQYYWVSLHKYVLALKETKRLALFNKPALEEAKESLKKLYVFVRNVLDFGENIQEVINIKIRIGYKLIIATYPILIIHNNHLIEYLLVFCFKIVQILAELIFLIAHIALKIF